MARVPARGISPVYRVSFETTRRRGIRSAFAFDPDVASEGWELIPPDPADPCSLQQDGSVERGKVVATCAVE